MLCSYHNHTAWSDGTGSIANLVESARNLGLDEVGISDHFVLEAGGISAPWNMPLDRLPEYVEQVLEAGGKAASPAVRLALEVDFFPETMEMVRPALARHPFDLVIGSVHFVDGFPVDEEGRLWDALSREERDEKWRLYWLRIRQMAESRAFDVAAHLDLPKKFGHRPQADLGREIDAALDALAAAGMALEINTAGWSLPAREAYPSIGILRAARRRGLPLILSADAHRPEHLLRDFGRARELAREAGYAELVRFEKRRRIPAPLE
jgi:histidinol-phosphatase (PHP family)